MNPLDSAPEMQGWEYRDKKRKADDIGVLIADLSEAAAALEGEIGDQERLSRVTDPDNAAYPQLAKMLRLRLTNLRASLGLLKLEKLAALKELRLFAETIGAAKASH